MAFGAVIKTFTKAKQNIVQNVRAFGYVFYKSLTSLNYYNDVLVANLRLSIKYYLVLVAAASAIVGGVVAFRTSSVIFVQVDDLVARAKQSFPADLEIKIENGEMSILKNGIDSQEPVVVPAPQDFESYLQNAQGQTFTNIVVFDPAGTVDDVARYNAFVLVNQKNALITRQTGEIITQPLSNWEGTVINKETFSALIDNLRGFVVFVPVLVFLLSFAGFFIFNLLVRSLSILGATVFLTVFTMIAGLWIGRKPFGIAFRNCFKIVLHVATVPVLVETALAVLNVPFDFPLWYFMALMVLGLVVVFSVGKSDKVETQQISS